MIQTERQTGRAAEVGEGTVPCASETSEASLPKEQGQPRPQMKPEVGVCTETGSCFKHF